MRILWQKLCLLGESIKYFNNKQFKSKKNDIFKTLLKAQKNILKKY